MKPLQRYLERDLYALKLYTGYICFKENAISEHTLEWEAESVPSGGPYIFTVSLPAEEPRLYALILEVFDHAGNVGYARSLLFYDNSSTVELLSNTSLRVTSANPA